VPPCPLRLLCRRVDHGTCRKEPGCLSASIVTLLSCSQESGGDAR
jgi:hypothetical protein